MRVFYRVLILCIFLIDACGTFASDNINASSQSSIYPNSIRDAERQEVIPYKKDADVYSSAVGGIFFVIVIFFAIAFLLFKHKSKLARLGLLPVEQGKHLIILDRQKLGMDTMVYLIAVDQKKYLLVVDKSGSSINEIKI